MYNLLNVNNFMQSCNLYHKFSDHFLHVLQEAASSVRVLAVLNMYINSLGKNLALNLVSLPSTPRLGMLGNMVDSPGFAMVTLVGHSLDE